jgi:hypothetical protein
MALSGHRNLLHYGTAYILYDLANGNDWFFVRERDKLPVIVTESSSLPSRECVTAVATLQSDAAHENFGIENRVPKQVDDGKRGSHSARRRRHGHPRNRGKAGRQGRRIPVLRWERWPRRESHGRADDSTSFLADVSKSRMSK